MMMRRNVEVRYLGGRRFRVLTSLGRRRTPGSFVQEVNELRVCDICAVEDEDFQFLIT